VEDGPSRADSDRKGQGGLCFRRKHRGKASAEEPPALIASRMLTCTFHGTPRAGHSGPDSRSFPCFF
jgi:hypothetical protein